MGFSRLFLSLTRGEGGSILWAWQRTREDFAVKRWKIIKHPQFAAEVAGLHKIVQDGLKDAIQRLEKGGPNLTRPHVDTLNVKGYTDKHHNVKELRFNAAGGVWRVIFILDPKRQAVLLAAGDKKGKNEKRFYDRLIRTALRRYADHLARL